MARGNAITFLSGRFLSLFLLMAFQLLVVRLLPPVEYSHFAMVFALAVMMQTILSFGIPRLIPKYVGQAGWSLPPATVACLIRGILAFRLVTSLLAMMIGLGAAQLLGWLNGLTISYILGGTTYILVSVIQTDADAIALSLGLQKLSRTALVGEATVRLALVAATALTGCGGEAATLLWIGTATALTAVIIILVCVRRSLAAIPANPEQAQPLDLRELRAIALSGYASAIAWFASSPATIRLIANQYLSVIAFAGFSFMQTLAVSFQRYTPGMLLFPFVEPSVMRHYARTGDQTRLESTLSLIIKIDLIIIGGTVVGTTVAGDAIIGLMTGGRYMTEAYALPWLLAYLATTSAYRAFEIVAVTLNAATALNRTLTMSLLWIAIALLLTPRLGLTVLLICPVLDSLSRLALMHRALARIGVKKAVDLPMTVMITATILAIALSGRLALASINGTMLTSLMAGVAAGILFLLLTALFRPFRHAEMALMDDTAPRPVAKILQWVSRP